MNEGNVDLKALKAGGLIKQKDGLFTVRLRVVGGRMEERGLAALALVARKYGRGYVHLTTRQGVEIPYVRLEDAGALRADLAAGGLEVGVCGASVRTITACQGAAICAHGLIDTQALAMKIDKIFYGRGGLPHKFKIAITGCPNACIKPLENDLGIMGLARKAFRPERCTLCGLCVQVCPAGALAIRDDRLIYSDEKCIACGACAAACQTGAWALIGAGYAFFVGGKVGKNPRAADRLNLEAESEEDVLRIVSATLDWYAANGRKGERFGETLDRLGVAALEHNLKARMAQQP